MHPSTRVAPGKLVENSGALVLRREVDLSVRLMSLRLCCTGGVQQRLRDTCASRVGLQRKAVGTTAVEMTGKVLSAAVTRKAINHSDLRQDSRGNLAIRLPLNWLSLSWLYPGRVARLLLPGVCYQKGAPKTRLAFHDED